jgi:hypothetical protein
VMDDDGDDDDNGSYCFLGECPHEMCWSEKRFSYIV